MTVKSKSKRRDEEEGEVGRGVPRDIAIVLVQTKGRSNRLVWLKVVLMLCVHDGACDSLHGTASHRIASRDG